MVKVVHIANPVAGVGVYLDLLAKYSDEKKFIHVALCNTQITPDDLKIHVAGHIPLRRQINFFKDVKCLLEIIRRLKKISPDIIHCHSAKAGILGRIAGIYLKTPTFYTPHAYSYLSVRSKMMVFIYKKIERQFRFFSPKTIACSTSEYNRTLDDLKFKKEKVFLWNNSVEDNLHEPTWEISLKLPKDYICSIGRPSFQKNTELLLASILEVKKEIKNIKLVILGVGFYAPDLKKVNDFVERHKLQNNIMLVPWLERSEVISIVKASKFYISTSRYEGLPYAVLEAMALAKPSIVTDVDGNNDLIYQDQNGFCVPQNAIVIANKIITLLGNDSMLENMGKNARETFMKKYNISDNIGFLEDIYSLNFETHSVEA